MRSTAVKAPPSLFTNSLEHLLAGLVYIDLRVRWAVARARTNGLNPDDEFRGLYISDEQVDNLLSYDLGTHLWTNANNGSTNASHRAESGQPTSAAEWVAVLECAYDEWQTRTQASRATAVPLIFDQFIQAFALTREEVDIFLIALAPELDPRYARLFAYLQDDVTRKRPSIDLILNLLTDSFNAKLRLRRLFTDNGRLLQSCLLIRFAEGVGAEPTLLAHYVRPAAHLVEHLLGQPGLDSQLADCAHLLPAVDSASPRRLTPDFLTQLINANQSTSALPPIFAFIGGYGVGKQEAAHCLASAAGQPLLAVNLAALARSELGLDNGLQLVLRDGRLATATLYLEEWDTVLENGHAQHRFFQRLHPYPHTIIIASTGVWQPTNSWRRRVVYTIQFEKPAYDRRLQIWEMHLTEENNLANLALAQIANHFRFTPGQIEDAIATARDLAQWRDEPLTTDDLFAASRIHSNQKLAALAEKIHPRYSWGDIVLPEDTMCQLQEMVNMVRQRPFVYGEWGFDRKLALGKGLNALFAGDSGTGKTMAADIMAGELRLDLYKVDLSSLVSKYIGETEKNLDRIFTEAATSNAILFFDEADAIFGKRSEVKDSHDRYANIEISYLLQRMEAYDGVVILATNLRANLDDAFTRRLHFAVEFPFPEATDRERIWQVNFPAETPVAPDVDFKLLAQQFRLAGGSIRNIILTAAFLAAQLGQPVGMAHLLHAARREYQKIGRLIDEKQFMVKREA